MKFSKLNFLYLFIVFCFATASAGWITFYGLHTAFSFEEVSKTTTKMHTVFLKKKSETFLKNSQKLADESCVNIKHTYTGFTCARDSKTQEDFSHCVVNVDINILSPKPVCLVYEISHIKTPDAVKTIYMTSYVAGNRSFRNSLINIVDSTEINSVMIDIKEVDGYVNYSIGNKEDFPFQKNLMGNLGEFIEYLHSKGIYVIARVVLFKDKAWVEANPQHAVKRSDTTTVWRDYGGKKYIDPGAEEFWDYLVNISSEAYKLGFDEINADYIRFPSDGKMTDIYYPYSQETINSYGKGNGRAVVLENFMKYYTSELRELHPSIVISADVFGMVTTNTDDLTIGQLLEPFIEHFDYVAPMVYPSHYPVGFIGLQGHPDNYPYEVVYASMKRAFERSEKLSEGHGDKLRPWLQDFTCTWCKGAGVYTSTEVRKQIQATYDAGLDSWMLWNAGNRYHSGALLAE